MSEKNEILRGAERKKITTVTARRVGSCVAGTFLPSWRSHVAVLARSKHMLRSRSAECLSGSLFAFDGPESPCGPEGVG